MSIAPVLRAVTQAARRRRRFIRVNATRWVAVQQITGVCASETTLVYSVNEADEWRAMCHVRRQRWGLRGEHATRETYTIDDKTFDNQADAVALAADFMRRLGYE